MAKSKSFFGLRRGSTKTLTYSVLDGQQITKDRVTQVKNPRTVSQLMQRMKAAPAQKFYNALNSASANGVINHSFEGVAYHEPTRRAFLSLAMKKNGGPYVMKGVQTWVPADYVIAKGSLPVPAVVFGDDITAESGETLHIIKSGDTLDAADVQAMLLINIAQNVQVSIVAVGLNGSVYEPTAYEFIAKAGETIPDSDYGFTLTIATKEDGSARASLNVGQYAGAIILSRQDAGGKWLRSDSRMWISDLIRAQYYTGSALQAAIDSYAQDKSANSLNSPYFLNQATSRAYDGSIIAVTVTDAGTTEASGKVYTFLMGMKADIDGQIRYQYVTTDGKITGGLVGIDGKPIEGVTVTDVDGWPDMDAYPMLGAGDKGAVQYTDGMLAQAGF